MNAASLRHRLPWPWTSRPAGHAGWLVPCAIVCLAFGMRLPALGNPIAGLDEQFYLLVGDRIWSGSLPYSDIWDRKPPGLFLLYAIVRALPGDGVLAYQLVGVACLALTGVVAARITTAVLPARAAFLAGAAVVVYGVLLGAGFGEAPIFYDLLTVIAGASVLSIYERPGDDARLDRRALAAMALCGVALTLKTSAVFESCCFGLLLLDHDRRHGVPVATLLRRASAYVAIGLTPIFAFGLLYAALGQWDAFWFANFESALLRPGGADADSLARLIACLLLLSPLIIPAAAEWRRVPDPRRTVLTAWLVAGLLSYVAIGQYHEHYAVPLVTPLALMAAYGFQRRALAWPLTGAVALVGVGHAVTASDASRRDRADVAALAASVPAEVRKECLFVYEGPAILYHLSGACLPGRYVFPGHFTDPREDGALGRPQIEVLRDTLARRPGAIVSVPRLREGGAETANDRLLREHLDRFYVPIARHGVRLYGVRRVEAVVWRRR